MSSTLKIVFCAFGLTASTLASAEELGRLFYTPEQRAQLDYNYAQGADSTNNSSTLMLNGIVQKHGGKRTIWINGIPQQAGASNERSPDSVPVAVPGEHKSVKLKVGQRVLLNPSSSPDAIKPDTPGNLKQ